MRKLTILFILILSGKFAGSQNIYSALHLNQDREYKTKRPKVITETNTFYNSSGKQVDKNIKTFDNAGMLLVEERHDVDGILTARLTYTNDTTNKIKLSRTFERWPAGGYTKETSFYRYDINNYLIGVTDKDANGNIFRETTILCNDKGHPIELSVFENGTTYGKEIAHYLYDKNKAVTSVISNDGKILTTDTLNINYKTIVFNPGDNEAYNSNGDLINWTSRNPDNSETVFEAEYTYDDFGNCVDEKIYKITVKRNGKRKRKINRDFKKAYTY
jgi:hypothetical protein